MAKINKKTSHKVVASIEKIRIEFHPSRSFVF